MTSLYTNEVRQYIHSRPWPKGVVFDVIEYDNVVPVAGVQINQQYLAFRFYLDNFATLSYDEMEHAKTVVTEVMWKLRNDGIPCYLEKVQSVPKSVAD